MLVTGFITDHLYVTADSNGQRHIQQLAQASAGTGPALVGTGQESYLQTVGAAGTPSDRISRFDGRRLNAEPRITRIRAIRG